MDNVELNNSPDLSMEDITKQLFNNEFMSDIKFLVEGKTMFAHSWELMKRSMVFREQFRGTLGDNKLITIDDTSHEVFYQFLRFIYTDNCDVKEPMCVDMLKLAVRYKIVKLENKVLNMLTTPGTDLTLLEFSVENKYELYLNYAFHRTIGSLSGVIETDKFLTIKSNVLEEILKSDHMPSEMTETALLNSLVRWMNKSCELFGTPISQKRIQFDQLLRLIRFPLMSNDEFSLCVKNHPDLLLSDEISTICTQIVLKGHCTNARWIAQPRFEYNKTWERQKPAPNQKWILKFTVLANLIMQGLRLGSGFSDFEMQILGTNLPTNTAKRDLIFNFEDSQRCSNIISLGETLKLKPNVDYMVEIKYRDAENYVFCRKPNVNFIVTGPSELIKFTETSDNFFEIIVKLATD